MKWAMPWKHWASSLMMLSADWFFLIFCEVTPSNLNGTKSHTKIPTSQGKSVIIYKVASYLWFAVCFPNEVRFWTTFNTVRFLSLSSFNLNKYEVKFGFICVLVGFLSYIHHTTTIDSHSHSISHFYFIGLHLIVYVLFVSCFVFVLCIIYEL